MNLRCHVLTMQSGNKPHALAKPVEKKKRYLEPPSSETRIKVTNDDMSFFAEHAGMLSKFSTGDQLQRVELVNRKCVLRSIILHAACFQCTEAHCCYCCSSIASVSIRF